MDARITGVVLTHNEAANIIACLEHLRPHVGEIILVDTESTDSTVELARPLVDKILIHPHVRNFDSARNLAIPEAQYDWLWFVDADEQIPQLTGEIVNRLIREQGDSFEALNIPFKSYFCGQWMQHSGWWPGYTCTRVIKRGCGEFSRRLHGGVQLTGRELRLAPDARTGIEHYSYRSVEHWIDKCNRYTSTESAQLAERGTNWDWRLATRLMVRDLWEYYERNAGRQDGDRGWILAWLSAQYRWFSVAKLVDQGRCPADQGGPVSVPADLDEFVEVLEQELASFRALRPELPLGVHWRAPLWADDDASALLRQTIVQQLASGTRQLSLEIMPSAAETQLNSPERMLLQTLARVRRAKHVVSITTYGADLLPPDPCAVTNVLWLGSREPRITNEAWPVLAAYDEIWTDTSERARELIQHGYAPEKIYVLETLSSSAGLEAQLCRIEDRYRAPMPPAVTSAAVRVEWEGELFAGHSFANVNEQLALQLQDDPALELSLHRVRYNPTQDQDSLTAPRLRSLIDRPLSGAPEIVVRHSFPPNWQRPAHGKWVHIQPWEFGHLPTDWLVPLRDQVDEIWVMSRYVEQVYLRSGVAAEKLHYIPWGIDPALFQPAAPPRILPTDKKFRFLYVGGTTLRKGFDRLFAAYLAEFTAEDDVCLLVKDVGTDTFYRGENYREQIRAAQQDPRLPRILYYQDNLTPGQLASLYTACDCLAAPYRGEGFCLPVLEAMACGLAPIVPQGGPTDDFVSPETGYLVPAREVAVPNMQNLCGPGLELEIDPADLRRTLRRAFEQRAQTQALGHAASQHVHQSFTWRYTADLVRQRLQALTGRHTVALKEAVPVSLAVLLQPPRESALLADRLARIRPFVEQVFVAEAGLTEQEKLIAQEYGAMVVAEEQLGQELSQFPVDWLLHLPGELRLEEGWSTGMAGQLATASERTEIRISLAGADEPTVHATRGHFRATRGGLGGTLSAAVPPRRSTASKTLLIQMADGAHCELLDLTRDHHRQYAQRHGMEYWCLTENPAREKRAGWGKIPLLLAGLRQGYETVIWLDADAVVARPEIDLAQACSQGIGMVRHPHPEHWNSGMIVVHNSPTAIRFWEVIEAQPENDSAWMEQLPINQLAATQEFASLIRPIDLAYNSVPGFALAEDPVIVAAHGLPMERRIAILREWLPPFQESSSDVQNVALC